jgi:quercetin dioxygenase-like cupin family protein
MLRWFLACAALAATAVAAAGIALGTPPFLASGTPPVRWTIAEPVNVKVKGAISLKTKTAIDLVTQTVTIQPGGHSGWHGHPGPVLVLVKAGTVTFFTPEDQTCAGDTYTAGQALVDPGTGHLARNTGSVPVELSFTYLLPVGAPPRTDLADPGPCVPRADREEDDEDD